MSTETIARRYSVALADAIGGSSETEVVKTELAGWASLFRDNADLQTVFGNPAITHANKENVLKGLIDLAKPSKTTANFLKVLLQNGRLADIGEIHERFVAVLDERSGLISAEIISARELQPGEMTEFEKSIENLTGKRVTVNYAVDKEIIGGVVTRIGSTVYDGSVKTKLENLR